MKISIDFVMCINHVIVLSHEHVQSGCPPIPTAAMGPHYEPADDQDVVIEAADSETSSPEVNTDLDEELVWTKTIYGNS